MSVAITNPCVLIDAAALARVVPGGRARIRGLLEAHPAVLRRAHDHRLEVAVLGPRHAADAHELAAELRRVIPAASGLRDRCLVIDDPDKVIEAPWVHTNWPGIDEYSTATHVELKRRYPARYTILREAVGLERTATRPVHLAQRAFVRMGIDDLSAKSTEVYTPIICSNVMVTLLIEESRDASVLRYTIVFPVGPTAHTAEAFEAAVARVQARVRLLELVPVGIHQHVMWQFVQPCDLDTTTVDDVVQTIEQLLTSANLIGAALARVAFGDAPPECVEPVMDALFQKA